MSFTNLCSKFCIKKKQTFFQKYISKRSKQPSVSSVWPLEGTHITTSQVSLVISRRESLQPPSKKQS